MTTLIWEITKKLIKEAAVGNDLIFIKKLTANVKRLSYHYSWGRSTWMVLLSAIVLFYESMYKGGEIVDGGNPFWRKSIEMVQMAECLRTIFELKRVKGPSYWEAWEHEENKTLTSINGSEIDGNTVQIPWKFKTLASIVGEISEAKLETMFMRGLHKDI